MLYSCSENIILYHYHYHIIYQNFVTFFSSLNRYFWLRTLEYITFSLRVVRKYNFQARIYKARKNQDFM